MAKITETEYLQALDIIKAYVEQLQEDLGQGPKKECKRIDELDTSVRLFNSLRWGCGVDIRDDASTLENITEVDLRKARNVGRKTILEFRELKKALNIPEHGFMEKIKPF